MSKLRGQKTPRMGFLSVKDTWQQIQLEIGERGRIVTSPACSSGCPSVSQAGTWSFPEVRNPHRCFGGTREVSHRARVVD